MNPVRLRSVLIAGLIIGAAFMLLISVGFYLTRTLPQPVSTTSRVAVNAEETTAGKAKDADAVQSNKSIEAVPPVQAQPSIAKESKDRWLESNFDNSKLSTEELKEKIRILKERERQSMIRFGKLPEVERKWFKSVQDKHDRIMKQLAEQERGGKPAIERYLREEIIAMVAFDSAAVISIRLQEKRDGLEPLSVSEANIQYKKAPLRVIASMKQKRLSDLQAKMKQIADDKAALKKFKIADDVDAIKKTTASIRSVQEELTLLMKSPLATGNHLNMTQPQEGQVGKIHAYKILQILDKSEGTALLSREGNATLRIVGMDLTNLIDGSWFPSDRTFVVTGTVTYDTVSGGSNTIFELQYIPDIVPLTDADLKDASEAANPNYLIVLNKEEESMALAARAVNEEKSAKKAAEDKVRMAEKATRDNARLTEEKSRRSQSFLDSGKILLKGGKNSGARKQFEKAIAEQPESDAAKEAQKLLDGLPQ